MLITTQVLERKFDENEQNIHEIRVSERKNRNHINPGGIKSKPQKAEPVFDEENKENGGKGL